MEYCDPDLAALLSRHGQDHLWTFWPELSAAERAELTAELRSVDFELVGQLYQHGEQAHDWAALAVRADSPPAFRLTRPREAGPPLTSAISPTGRGSDKSQRPAEVDDARRRGLQAIPHVAVVLVAGGQGTRLGFHHPKGMYPIGPLSGSSLFQVLFEKTLAMGRLHGVRIPLYVMTSPATHDETSEFLAEHQRFGLAPEDVTLFCQGTMPAVDAATGRLLLAEKHRLALSPDGTGGIVAAMQRHGVLRQMRDRGIRHVFYMQVDNPLVSVCDAEFLGFHLLAGSELSTLVVAKESPLEPLGNVVSIDGQVHILEYSDLARVAGQHPQIIDRRQPDGTSLFWAGNLGIHFIEVAFLERVAESELPEMTNDGMTNDEGRADPAFRHSVIRHSSLRPPPLPFHVAKKKVPHIDTKTGQRVSPRGENAIKFERFVFDMLPAAGHAIVVEVDRRTQFAPLKNAAGAAKDTPEAVQAQIVDVHRDWLRSAGATVADGVRVEISPLWANDADAVRARLPRGAQVGQDRYFAAEE